MSIKHSPDKNFMSDALILRYSDKNPYDIKSVLIEFSGFDPN